MGPSLGGELTCLDFLEWLRSSRTLFFLGQWGGHKGVPGTHLAPP